MLDTDDIIKDTRVSRSSTINVRTNMYPVPSRLIGQFVGLRVGAEQSLSECSAVWQLIPDPGSEPHEAACVT